MYGYGVSWIWCKGARGEIELDPCIDRGGLGLRRTQYQNKAFLLKHGFNFLLQKYALWVRILRSKYKIDEDCPQNIKRRCCSFIWKYISSVWSDLRSSLFWHVGDGRRVRCWTNHWIKELGPLSNYCTNTRPFFLNVTVYAMVSLEGGWNCEYFERDSPGEVLLYMAGIHPPKDDAGEDQVAWRLTDNSKCIVASGYCEFTHGDWPLRDRKWKLIWKLHVPQRVR